MQPVPMFRHPVLKELQEESEVDVISSVHILSVQAVVAKAPSTL